MGASPSTGEDIKYVGGAVARSVKRTIKGTAHQVRKHPVISAGVGGFALGSYRTQPYVGDTINKGRAVNKHPYSGGNYYG